MTDYNLTEADVPAARLRQPSVEIRAEGADGYVVVFRDPAGFPHDVRRFTASYPKYDEKLIKTMKQASAEARAYRDGFADGLVRASRVLAGVLGQS